MAGLLHFAINAVGGVEAAHVAMAAKNPELLTFFNDAKGQPLGIIAILSLLGIPRDEWVAG